MKAELLIMILDSSAILENIILDYVFLGLILLFEINLQLGFCSES